MVDLSPRAPRRRRSWPWLAVPVILMAAWSALWLVVSHRANAALDGWLAAEAEGGRDWTCPARHLGGFPFTVKLRCDRPTFHGEVAGRIADGIVEGVIAEVHLDHPTRLSVRLRSPLNLHSVSDDFDLALAWDGLALTADDLVSSVPRGAIAATRLAVTLRTVGQGDLNLRAAALSATAAPAPAEPRDADFAFEAHGLSFPTLAALPGLDQATEAIGRGTLIDAGLLRAPTRARLDAWRQAGGALHLAALDVTKGSFHGTAVGTLALDDTHRPAGRLDASLAGFEPIARHFGIPIIGVQLGGLLSSLLGGGARPNPAVAGAVQMQLVLEGGALLVGPFKTGVRLDPFY